MSKYSSMPSATKVVYFIVALAPILMSSVCGLPHYGTGHTANEISYLAKPAYNDTSSNAIYISGKFSHSISSNYENEKNYFGELSLHRSHTWRYLSLSYGMLGYAGSHKIARVEQYPGNKLFAGTGLTGEVMFNIPFKEVDWRIIGIRTTGIYESGRYASFRKTAETDSLIVDMNPNNLPVNVSASTEVVLKLKKGELGIYNVMGKTFGKRENSLLFTHGVNFRHHQFVYSVQYSLGEWQGFSLSAGLACRLHQRVVKNKRIAPEFKP